jgi:hypothetical protein
MTPNKRIETDLRKRASPACSAAHAQRYPSEGPSDESAPASARIMTEEASCGRTWSNSFVARHTFQLGRHNGSKIRELEAKAARLQSADELRDLLSCVRGNPVFRHRKVYTYAQAGGLMRCFRGGLEHLMGRRERPLGLIEQLGVPLCCRGELRKRHVGKT